MFSIPFMFSHQPPLRDGNGIIGAPSHRSYEQQTPTDIATPPAGDNIDFTETMVNGYSFTEGNTLRTLYGPGGRIVPLSEIYPEPS